MPVARARKEAPICAAIKSAPIDSASLHHLRTSCMMFESFADCPANGKRCRSGARSMHGAQHSTPPRALRQVQQRVNHTLQPLQKGALPIVRAAGLHRPVDQKRPAHDGIAVHKSPVAAILTAITVISHSKIFAGGNDYLVAVYVFSDFMR